jgi:hypothetical protein
MRPHIVPLKLPSQRLRILANGHPVASFDVRRRSTRVCTIPVAAIGGRDEIELTLETPDATRPIDQGKGDTDSRPLAFAFSSLLLYPDKTVHDPMITQLFGEDAVPVDIDRLIEADKTPVSDLMLEFESLGQNCEFGLVQRQCKAEPLSLLRFSSTPLPQLLTALDQRFEGMGDVKSLDVHLSPNGREYMVQDERFGFLYHAWVKAGEMTAAELQRRESRRLPFLIRKLLEDLEEGRKTFVFKGMSSLPEEEVYPLAAAIRRYGPNTLLLVNLADDQHLAGSVEARAPGFFVGYVDRFAPTADAGDVGLQHWIQICRQAYRLRLATG